MEILVMCGAIAVSVLLSAAAVSWSRTNRANFVTDVGIDVINSLEKESRWDFHVVPVDAVLFEATIGTSVFLLMPRWSPIKRKCSVKIVGYSCASSGWPACVVECVDFLGVVDFVASGRTGLVNTNEAAFNLTRTVCRPLVEERRVDLIKIECEESRCYIYMRELRLMRALADS